MPNSDNQANNLNPLRVLHFADAHIDIANYGRHDPDTALPIRVMDFLSALDQIIGTAVEEKVDLVIFAGDVYKDRNPQPTFQQAWGKRMMRLSANKIPTVLLVGNHDVAPAAGRAHTLQEFGTFEVPYIHIADRIKLLKPDDLGLPIQIITVPWISRSQLMTRAQTTGKSLGEVFQLIEDKVTEAIEERILEADSQLPLVLTAHASVQGAHYGSERAVMLGHELVLSGSVVNDKRLDYVALGHIHKHQSLSGNRQPPIVYPGSIERIDFGEAKEKKGFVLAEITKGHAEWRFVPLKTRRFIDLSPETTSADTFMDDILTQLPSSNDTLGAICRVQLSYPRDWEPLLDESAIFERFEGAMNIQIQKHRQSSKRIRLGDTMDIDELTPEELLNQYWQSMGLDKEESSVMQELAKDVLARR